MNTESTPSSESHLSVTSLELRRGERRLFSGLDFELGPGQIAMVTGANGSGKTTLLRALAGLTLPAAGVAVWSGNPVHRLPAERRGEIAFQGHQDGLKKELTVLENLRFYRAFWRSSGSIEATLEALRLEDFRNREVRFLSAGQRRRAALGCMRLKGARLWLLDEPLTNLDVGGGELVAEWLDRHTEAGGLAVVASHQSLSRSGSVSVEIELS